MATRWATSFPSSRMSPLRAAASRQKRPARYRNPQISERGLVRRRTVSEVGAGDSQRAGDRHGGVQVDSDLPDSRLEPTFRTPHWGMRTGTSRDKRSDPGCGGALIGTSPLLAWRGLRCSMFSAPGPAFPRRISSVLHPRRVLVAGDWLLVAQSALRTPLAAWGNGQGKCVEAAQGGAELILSGGPDCFRLCQIWK